MSFGPTLVFLLSLALAGSIQPADQYYKELGCKLVPSGDSTEKYDCDILNQIEDDQCYYNGVHYSVGQRIKQEELRGACMADCSCRQLSEKASFSCAQIECPSVFNPPLEEGCTHVYESGECCPVSEHCDGKEPPVPTCEFQGKTYKKGEKMYPSEGCMTCICQEGFNGTLSEPWCQKTQCNLYLHYSSRLRAGCVPTYYKPTDCCPIPVWRCPSDEDSITDTEEEEEASPKAQDKTCTFGNLKLEVGQKLSPSSDRCVECSCLVPPHVSCIMDRECYEKF